MVFAIFCPFPPVSQVSQDRSAEVRWAQASNGLAAKDGQANPCGSLPDTVRAITFSFHSIETELAGSSARFTRFLHASKCLANFLSLSQQHINWPNLDCSLNDLAHA
jgi:hypothetical protein